MNRQPPQVRQAELLAIVRRDGYLQVSQIASRLAVSEMTIRRDLIEMEKNGLLLRTHGGATVGNPDGHPVDREEPTFASRLNQRRESKEAIARSALGLLDDEVTVAIDVGSSTYLLAAALVPSPQRRIFTNSLRIALQMRQRGHEVAVPGGQVRGNEMSVCGNTAVEQFGRLWFDIAFIGVSGITESGLFDYSMDDSEMKRVYITQAARKVVLCDASKFQRRSLVQIADLQDIDALVTDAPPPAELAAALSEAGVEVIIAELPRKS